MRTVRRFGCIQGLRRVHWLLGLVVCAASILAARAVPAAGRPWVEVASPNFTVISDAGEKDALRAAWQFEQVRAVLKRLWPWARIATGKPVVVFAARDENTLRGLAPEYWEKKGGVRPSGVSVSGPDRHYIAIRVDLSEPDSLQANPYFNSYWSYLYITLMSSFGRELPLWLGRGLSGVLANTIVRDKDVQLGRVVPWHLTTLRDSPRVRLSALLGVDRQSPYMTRGDQFQQFEASAWALVHYLGFGENGTNLPKLNRLLELVVQGKDANASLVELYGPLDRLDEAVHVYVARTLYTYQLIAADVDVSVNGFKRRPLSAAESAGTRGVLLAAMGRPVEARALAQEAMKADAASPLPYEIEGLLADRGADRNAARAGYARACELGSTSFYAYYRQAQLLWTPAPEKPVLEQIEGSLQKAIHLNSGWAPGYSYLADVMIDLGDAEGALGLARRAVSLEPGASRPHAVVARALGRLSRSDEAMREAEAALALAKEPGEREQAERLIAYLRGVAK